MRKNSRSISTPTVADDRRQQIRSDQTTDNIRFLQADKLATLIKAAGVEVEPIWTQLFAKVRPPPEAEWPAPKPEN